MRLSELFHMPVFILEMVLPAWEMIAWAEKLSKEPTPQERTEIVLAYLCSLIYNSKKGKNKPAKKVSDFMLFKDAWKEEDKKKRYVSDDDVNDDINTIIDALGRDRLIVQKPITE